MTREPLLARREVALPVHQRRSILVQHATVRLSLTAPITPPRGPIGWPRRPVLAFCRPSAPSRPSTRCTSSAASDAGGFGPTPRRVCARGVHSVERQRGVDPYGV